MRSYTIAFSILLLFCSCMNDKKKKAAIIPRKEMSGPAPAHTVGILPFKNTDKHLIAELKKGMQEKIGAEFIILDEMNLPASAFYRPRQRYIADSLLIFLAKTNNKRYEKIIGVTVKDISTRKGEIVNWGILGLGSCPGEACVISSFRAGQHKVSAADFRRRMITLALHELGHTYGLEHCAIKTCLMKDAQGKMNLDDGDSYCNECRDYLSGKDLLPVSTPSEK